MCSSEEMATLSITFRQFKDNNIAIWRLSFPRMCLFCLLTKISRGKYSSSEKRNVFHIVSPSFRFCIVTFVNILRALMVKALRSCQVWNVGADSRSPVATRRLNFLDLATNFRLLSRHAHSNFVFFIRWLDENHIFLESFDENPRFSRSSDENWVLLAIL